MMVRDWWGRMLKDIFTEENGKRNQDKALVVGSDGLAEISLEELWGPGIAWGRPGADPANLARLLERLTPP